VKRAVILIATVVFASLLAGPAAAGAAGTSAEAAPFGVRIVSPDGKPKIKVVKKLSAVMSCNRDCRMSVRFILRMPAGNLTNSGARNLLDGQFWTPGVILNTTAIRYLRKNYRASSFKVVVRARDLESGEVVSKIKIFRFYR
jgi:hypothetical protein